LRGGRGAHSCQRGCDCLAKDRFKLELARDFGAQHTINVDEESTVDRVLDITGGVGADVER
jgi:NADPH:quinone reductase-like Zn-dependent oxidoreductase